MKKRSVDFHLGQWDRLLRLEIFQQRHRYDEIRSIYADQLVRVWMKDSTAKAIGVSVDEKINRFVDEGLNHATEMLSLLWEIANDDSRIIRSLPNTSSPVSRFYFYGVCGSAYSTSPDHADLEPCTLGLCGDGAHQVNS